MQDTKPNRAAVVTGTAGIALGIAHRLLDDGFAVTMLGNDADQNTAARTALSGREVEIVQVDVSDAAQVESAAKALSSRRNTLDALVNCAAIQPYGTIETTTPDDWNKVIGINLSGYFLTAHYFYPMLKANKQASIVNLASVQGHLNQNNVLGYATSKGAIHALTRAMAVDCARDGVRVNSISPGSIRTPLLEFAARSLTPEGGDVEETLLGFGKSHPIGRVGRVDEIAALVSFLVGAESGFCTGGDYAMDGGLRAHLGV
jgi:meso-butanediol dehydrogenase/(S,S)-butanediol dehydrogenase/diacetyl reductase